MALILKIVNISATDDYFIIAEFENCVKKKINFKEYLKSQAFLPLVNIDLFKAVSLYYGIPVWLNGKIDIAPEFIYENGVEID